MQQGACSMPTGVDGAIQLGQGVEHHRLQAANAIAHPARHVLQQAGTGAPAGSKSSQQHHQWLGQRRTWYADYLLQQSVQF